MLSGTPIPSGAEPILLVIGDLVRFVGGSAGTFSFASRLILSSSHSICCSAPRGASPPPAADNCAQGDTDEVDASVAICFAVIGGPGVVGIIGGVDAAASEISSLTEALGPRLEPLDPVITRVSPFGGFGLLLWTPSL